MKKLLNLYKTMFEFASVYKQAVLLAIVGLFSMSFADAVAQTLTTTTTITDSSGTQEIVNTDTISGSSGKKLNTTITPEKAQKEAAADEAAKKAEEAEKAEEAKKKEEANDVNYTGLYNDRQIVPDIMAIYCKTNGEEFLADSSKLDKCLNKYLLAMNNPNATLKAEGKTDYQALRLRTMLDALAVAVTKSASVANYEEVQNKMADSSRKAQTEREDGAAMSNTTSVATDVMNSIRELLAIDMFRAAIDGLETVSPDVLEAEDTDEEEDKNDTADTQDTADDPNAYDIESTTHLEPDSVADDDASSDEDSADEDESDADAQGLYVGDGKCSAGGTPVACTEGIHKDANNKEYVCEDGICYLKSVYDASENNPITPNSGGPASDGNIECFVSGTSVICQDTETNHVYTKSETECKQEGNKTVCYVRGTNRVMYTMQKSEQKKSGIDSVKGIVEGGLKIINSNNTSKGNSGNGIEGGMTTVGSNNTSKGNSGNVIEGGMTVVDPNNTSKGSSGNVIEGGMRNIDASGNYVGK